MKGNKTIKILEKHVEIKTEPKLNFWFKIHKINTEQP
jgi:hypothetical protein